MPTTTTAPTATKTTAASATAKGAKPPKPLPEPNVDFYYIYVTLPAEELAVVKRVREFVETKVAPVITDYWVKDQFPFDLLPAVKELGIGGLGMKGYGCAGGSLALLGFVQMELARVDPSFSTFVGVHNGLAMGSIYIDGSEKQKQKWLPPMARFDKVGWMSTGCAMGAFETAVKYSQERLQFGKPIGSFQLIQDLLARMIENITASQCLLVRQAQLFDEGKLSDAHAALSKAFCTSKCRETVAWAREILGGNGIVADYKVARFFNDCEALYTYEGTFQMQNLIVGKAVTGFSAFL